MEVIRGEEGDCGPKLPEDLSDVHFPAAKKIVLVQDNLSTHTPASLYAAPTPEARRPLKRYLPPIPAHWVQNGNPRFIMPSSCHPSFQK